MVSGATSTLGTIALFGAAERFDDSMIGHAKGQGPIHRSGGLFSLFDGEGISWGQTAWSNKNVNIDQSRMTEARMHESFHFSQQNKMGFANFYGTTAWEYLTKGHGAEGTLESSAIDWNNSIKY